MTDPNANFVPAHPEDWIEPGTETFAQRLENVQMLAASAVSARAELDAIWEDPESVHFLSNDLVKTGRSSETTAENNADRRAYDAEEALALEVSGLVRDGTLPLLVKVTDRPEYERLATDVFAREMQRDLESTDSAEETLG